MLSSSFVFLSTFLSPSWYLPLSSHVWSMSTKQTKKSIQQNKPYTLRGQNNPSGQKAHSSWAPLEVWNECQSPDTLSGAASTTSVPFSCQLDNNQASHGGRSTHTSPTEAAGEVAASTFHQGLPLLLQVPTWTSSWHCPAQNALWLLTSAPLKNQGQMLRPGPQGLPVLLPHASPTLFPFIINTHLVFWLHSS